MDIERRASERLAMELSTTCRVPATPHAATVVDLSLTGCRIRLQGDALLQGSTVHIDMRVPRPVQGRVVWATGQSAGIRFDRPLPEAAAVRFGLAEAKPPEPEPIDERPMGGGLHHWIRKILGWRLPAAG